MLTLSRALALLRQYTDNNGDLEEAYFLELDKDNGGSMVARALLEDCGELEIILGTAVNAAYQNSGLALSLHSRNQIVKQLKKLMEGMGKRVSVTRY